MRLQVRPQFTRLHRVDSRRPLVAFDRSQRPPVILRFDGLFHQVLVHRSLSRGPRKVCLADRRLSRLATAAPFLPRRSLLRPPC
jgi:hypothetical protein